MTAPPIALCLEKVGDRLITRFTTEAGSDAVTFNSPDMQVLSGDALEGDPLPRVIMSFQVFQERTKDKGGYDILGLFEVWGETVTDCTTLVEVIVNELTDDSDVLDLGGGTWNVLNSNLDSIDEPIPFYTEDIPYYKVTTRIRWTVFEN